MTQLVKIVQKSEMVLPHMMKLPGSYRPKAGITAADLNSPKSSVD
jgi:hypothetical protein